MTENAAAAALAAVERRVAAGGDADDVLRDAVRILHEGLGRSVRLSFVEGDRLVPGPAEGDGALESSFAIRWRGDRVAELGVSGALDEHERALVEQVCELLAPHALVGWDTGGEAWEP